MKIDLVKFFFRSNNASYPQNAPPPSAPGRYQHVTTGCTFKYNKLWYIFTIFQTSPTLIIYTVILLH